VLVGAVSGAEACAPILSALHNAGANLRIVAEHPGLAPLNPPPRSSAPILPATRCPARRADRSFALVFDATGVFAAEQSRAVRFLPARLRLCPSNGRVLILGRAPDVADGAAAAAGVRSV